MSDQLADARAYHEVRSSRTDLEGLVWDIRSDEVVYGDTILTRQYLSHRGAVAIIAMDDDDRVLLIQQYRHPVRAREWELPAGILDNASEDPISAAQRELLEETGLTAANWQVLVDFFPTPGGSNEAVRVFLARGLLAGASDFRATEEEADIELRWVPLDDAVTAILNRETQNGTLAIAVMAAFAAKTRGWTNATRADTPWDRHPSASSHQ